MVWSMAMLNIKCHPMRLLKMDTEVYDSSETNDLGEQFSAVIFWKKVHVRLIATRLTPWAKMVYPHLFAGDSVGPFRDILTMLMNLPRSVQGGIRRSSLNGLAS